MRLRTKIVLAITGMVVLMVTVFSFIYISQLLRQRLAAVYDDATQLIAQLAFSANNAIPDLSSTPVDTTSPEAMRAALGTYLQSDINLNNLMESMVGSWPFLYDAALVDYQGKALLHTNHNLVGKPAPQRPDFSQLRSAPFRQQLSVVLQSPTIYEVQLPLELNGTPFGSIRLGISTVFLRSEIRPRLRHALGFSIGAVLLSLVLAAGLSHIALSPLQRISERLDTMTAGQSPDLASDEDSGDEYGLVTLKIAHLGRQMQDVKEVFSALKGNLDQIMANLQDGLMLFTRDFRVVLVSASAEHFLGRPRSQMLGRSVHEVFSGTTPLGAFVLECFRQRRAVIQRELMNEGLRIQVSLDFIQEGSAQIGALLTIRDAESVRRIEDEIELSRRLAAIGRLTSGVAHEVKNPINAIVLHLENLRQKLPQLAPDANRHVDVIGSEIHRLDRVVQILVDFTRPVELRLEEADLRAVVAEVVMLAHPQAQSQNVQIESIPFPEEILVKIDVDLMKQALLNVVINGVQAMPQGGQLTVAAQYAGDEAVIAVRDHGPGIPADVRDKIFNLYFTTKKEGSGIGLAMTYRVLQMHHGIVDFESVEGAEKEEPEKENHGTSFFLRLPLLNPRPKVIVTR